MRRIGAFEAKNKLAALLDLAERGEEIVITKRGRAVAKLVPAKDSLVVTYCANLKCPASGKLAARLKELGYSNVIDEGLARPILVGRPAVLEQNIERHGLRLVHYSIQSNHVHALVEARATAQCNHDNIVIIHEVDEYEGSPYMVLEFLEDRQSRRRRVRFEYVRVQPQLHSPARHDCQARRDRQGARSAVRRGQHLRDPRFPAALRLQR
jgi:prevent-host-death family protein